MMQSLPLSEQIRRSAVQDTTPDGLPVKVLAMEQVLELAIYNQLSQRDVDLAALAEGIVPLRYTRNQRSYTCADQVRLLNASAAIVGLGGLGGTVLEILARAGVGRLLLIDGDRFEEHNLNRQLVCTQTRIGEFKAQAAARRVLEINPSVHVDARTVFLTESNAVELIGDCDVVLDCLDNIVVRFMVEQAARTAHIPMISAAVAGLAGHVTTIFPQDAGLALVYGPRTSIESGKGAETALGCLPQAVMLIASVESAEALKILTGRTGELLRNRLWVTDLSSNTFEILSLI
jgi:molybdopterin-synthase adenylyltransferase